MTHSLLEIVRRCAKYDTVFSQYVAICRKLDKYYIVTLYPNGLPGLTPAEYFDEAEAKESIEGASEVLDFVKARLNEMREGR